MTVKPTKNEMHTQLFYADQSPVEVLNDFPREIPVKSSKLVKHATFSGSPRTNRKSSVRLNKYGGATEVYAYVTGKDTSYTDMSRDIPGVNIRSDKHPYITTVPQTGQLRSAFSAMEGLDTMGTNVYDTNQFHDRYGTSNRTKQWKKKQASFEGVASTPSPALSTQSLYNGITPFEKVKRDVTKTSTYRNELRAGRRIGLYKFIVEIARGNFSRVKLAIHTLVQEEVAVKVIDRTKFNAKTRRLLSQEIQNMDRLEHPCIIRLFEVFETVQTWHLVMEHAPGGELRNFIQRNGRMAERLAKAVSAQIVAGLAYMHRAGVFHRDLKAENIFFSAPGRVKIGDLGFSKCCDFDAALTTFCGSPPYAAPELFVAANYTGAAVDLWALGVLIFYITAGQLPFRGDTIIKMKRVILSADYTKPAHFSPELKSLLSGLLEVKVEARFQMSKVENHIWFDNVHWMDSEENSINSSGQLSDENTRAILSKLWSVEAAEINKALQEGPKNSLTGIYRLLRSQGARHFGRSRSLQSENKASNHYDITNASQTKKLGATNVRRGGELTAVDLREKKVLKAKLEHQNNACTLL